MSPPDKNPSGFGVFDFPLRFARQYDDPETGVFYNYFRDCYDPVLGRYCQADPIGLRGGINPYNYVTGNPLGYIDPTGLLRCRWIGIVLQCEWGSPPSGSTGSPELDDGMGGQGGNVRGQCAGRKSIGFGGVRVSAEISRAVCAQGDEPVLQLLQTLV